MAVALIAMFVALGGTSYAAITITGKNVKNSSLSGADIKNGSLRGTDVRNRSLTSRDLSAGTISSLRGKSGPGGPAGPAGRAGSAQAYGFVTSAGAVDTARSRGITASRLTTAVYCVNAPGVSNTSRVPVVTVARDSLTGTQRNIQYLTGALTQPGCPNGWAFLTKDGNNNIDSPFSIVIP